MARLCREGFGSSLLLSHGVASRLQLEAYGGGGLTHISRSFVPRLLRAGLSAEQASALLENGARLLCWSLPAAAMPRKTKPWECSSCHRTFEEALNVAEATADDRVYYEKFSFRCPERKSQAMHYYCTAARPTVTC